MREIVFRLETERPGHLEARAETLPIRITAPTLEELQHEAREALIEHLGPAHCAYRVRVCRAPAAVAQQPSANACIRGMLNPLHAPLVTR